MTEPRIEPGYYRHFKGHLCNVSGLKQHTETLELMVEYTEPNVPIPWVRPYEMFISTVVVDGKQVKRFERVAELT